MTLVSSLLTTILSSDHCVVKSSFVRAGGIIVLEHNSLRNGELTPDWSAALSGASERAPGTVTRRVLILAIGAVLTMLLGSFGLGTSRDSLGSSFHGLEGATQIEEMGD